MLIRFSVKNYRSFRDKQELTLVASALKDSPESLISVDGFPHNLLRVAAIYGANASGKTNVLKALNFISWAVTNSQRNWEPEGAIAQAPFRLDDSVEKPSSFEIEFLLGKTRYQYGFILDSKIILEEWLYAYPSSKQQTWFTRDETGRKRFTFGRNLAGENRVIEALTRRNSLFLSAAAQNNHEMLGPIYKFLADELTSIPANRSSLPTETQEMCLDEKYKDLIAQHLSSADLGISGVKVNQLEVNDAARNVFTAIKALVPKADLDIPQSIPETFFLHHGYGNSQIELPSFEESEGTVAYFTLLGAILKALELGRVLCIDELDSSLHPLLALQIVRLFNNPKSNPRGAQLIFNTHDTNLLDESILRRDQIWFTEKDAEGATHLYPLSDFRPRKGENFERGYLQGRYGAIPFIESSSPAHVRED